MTSYDIVLSRAFQRLSHERQTFSREQSFSPEISVEIAKELYVKVMSGRIRRRMGKVGCFLEGLKHNCSILLERSFFTKTPAVEELTAGVLNYWGIFGAAAENIQLNPAQFP